MSQSLDAWYEAELKSFYRAAGEFAERFPRVAGRLALSDAASPDPHVERLIQAVALLNARTRRKLDDGFPEVASALLGILYPHLTAPLPSVSMVRFALNPGQDELTDGAVVPSGTLVEADDPTTPGDEPASYRTCGETTLYPLKLRAAELRGEPLRCPETRGRKKARAALRLLLEMPNPKMPVGAVRLRGDRLRFHVRLSDLSLSGRVLEAVTAGAVEVVVAGPEGEDGPPAAVLPATAVRHAGFNDEEALLPRAAQSQAGVHLVGEFFALPERFLFFEVCGLTPSVLAAAGRRLELFILLKSDDEEAAREVGPRTILLGCVPVVNLFRRTAQAVRLHERTSTYRIVADPRSRAGAEVYTVDGVRLEDALGKDVASCRFYSSDHQAMRTAGTPPVFWHASRQPGPQGAEQTAETTEMYLALIPPSGAGRSPEAAVESAHFAGPLPGGQAFCEVTCFNRGTPERLSKLTRGAVRMRAVGLKSPAGVAECLKAPSPAVRAHLGRRSIWPTVSQLALNHLSLGDEGGSPAALQELLAVNDFSDTAVNRGLIDGVESLSSRSEARRLGRSVVRGTVLSMRLAEERFTGHSPFLFAAVLSRFFAMHAAANSFVELTATTDRRAARKADDWVWPPRSGTGALL